MELLIEASGNARCVYGEAIDLAELGQLSIRRGSHVEPNEHGQWHGRSLSSRRSSARAVRKSKGSA